MKAQIMLTVLAAFLLFFSSFTPLAFAYTSEPVKVLMEKQFHIVLNGKEIVPIGDDGTVLHPFTVKGRAYLPLRYIAQITGTDVSWDNTSYTIKMDKRQIPDPVFNYSIVEGQIPTSAPGYASGKYEISFNLQYNGIPITLTNSDGTILYPITYNGNTYLPIRTVADMTGLSIGWDPTSETIYLISLLKTDS